MPLRQDFDSFNLTETTTNQVEPPTKFAYPPLPWIGARFKFEVRDRDTNKCLVKTVDNPFFQRATVFMGTPDLKNYTIEADVLSDGNRRKMSEVGVINQHYLIELKGNEQVLQITSNQELLRQSVPFKWLPNTWYHIKARVDVAADGSGVVRGKAWKVGDPEPEGWLNELAVHQAETSGCPASLASPRKRNGFILTTFRSLPTEHLIMYSVSCLRYCSCLAGGFSSTPMSVTSRSTSTRATPKWIANTGWTSNASKSAKHFPTTWDQKTIARFARSFFSTSTIWWRSGGNFMEGTDEVS